MGEVSDVKLGSPDEATTEQMYEPMTQGLAAYGSLANPEDLAGDFGYIALRASLPPEQMENSLRATVRAIDSQLPLTQVQTMEHAISETEAPQEVLYDADCCVRGHCAVAGDAGDL